MIFAVAGGVLGKASTRPPVQSILDDPANSVDSGYLAVLDNGGQQVQADDLGCWPIIRDAQASVGDLCGAAGKAEIRDEKKRGAVPFEMAVGPNRFALDGLRFSRGNSQRLGSFSRVGLIVLESDGGVSPAGSDLSRPVDSATRCAGSGDATVKQQNNGSLGQTIRLNSARHELLTAGCVKFVNPAPDKMPGASIPATLISTAHRLAVDKDDSFKVASETPGKTSERECQRNWSEMVDCQAGGIAAWPALGQLGRQAEAPNSEPVHKSGRQVRRVPVTRRTGYRARLRTQLLISFLLGAAATAAPMAFNKIAALHADYQQRGANFTDVLWMKDPLVLPRMYRDNRLFSYLDFAINRSKKQPYVGLQPAATELTAAEDAVGGASMAYGTSLEERAPAAELDDEADPGGPETPAQDGIRTLPSLYFDPLARRRMIGNFETRSLPGDYASCAEIAQSMILDAKAGQNSLHTLADTEEIKVMRICAANGTVIITCRNDQVTISPRRPRPDDGCNPHHASKPGVKTL